MVDWSYCANRIELGSRSDTASWMEEPYRCVVICCLLIDFVMLIDRYRSMIVRFASPATRGFLSTLLSLSCLVSLQRKKTSGTRVVWVLITYLRHNAHRSAALQRNLLFLFHKVDRAKMKDRGNNVEHCFLLFFRYFNYVQRSLHYLEICYVIDCCDTTAFTLEINILSQIIIIRMFDLH